MDLSALGEIVATRDLVYIDDAGAHIAVRMSIGKPVKSKFGMSAPFGVWRADGEPILLRRQDGVEAAVVSFAAGDDGVGAIHNALEGLRALLARVGDRISYDGCPGSGIRLTVTGFTSKVQMHLERLVEAEKEAILARLEDPATRSDELARIRDEARKDG